MSSSKRSQNEIAHGKKLSDSGAEQIWGWGTHAGKIRARRRAELISSAAGLRPGIEVLEIGCGTGVFTDKFAQSGAHITAVDISEELLKLARARNLPMTVTYILSPFEELHLDKPFDTIIGSSILHHLVIESALAQIYNMLKPGGVMSFAEPNMLNPQVLLQKNIPWLKSRMGDSKDETAFFQHNLKEQMRKVGFIETKITPLDWLHPATPPFMVSFVQKVGMVLERVPLLREFAGSLYIFGKRPT
jgi:2-polyprenyl-3-methyl-5-hydroxy-6-metoxy-1,4-benzoquinol methylase